MELLGHRPLGFMLSILLLCACDNGTQVEQRRSISQTNTDSRNETVDATANGTGTDPTFGTVDPDFRPEDPNTFPRKPGVSFPAVNFTVEGVPSGPSDRYNYTLPVKADSSISHYAYKVDSAQTCDKTGGYTVGEAKNPITMSLDKMPMGPLYLCVIAFHFPTRQWQDMTKALSFNWEKIVFKRTFDSYYEFVDTGCKNNARVTAKLTIEGEGGSYVWQQLSIPGCRSDPTSYTDLMSLIKVSETTMEGAWHEGATVAGWFKFTWTNPERTSFKGSWGYGAPGVKTEGVWNTIDN
ncbi:MAG TPA: hypothetical protein VE954_26535 [Oligoflexus sp.]|uniref:hypothetical protein n=1 Tax=Oligoflexus sp. TaxID=1971216 RepID=UPI002D4A9739|nr:hypothetical protein [Oligoflexus sp.]HYX36683.1 hypothetical protein [Oligoflexus sp.]